MFPSALVTPLPTIIVNVSFDGTFLSQIFVSTFVSRTYSVSDTLLGEYSTTFPLPSLTIILELVSVVVSIALENFIEISLVALSPIFVMSLAPFSGTVEATMFSA